MPALTLYEYFAKKIAKNTIHAVFARLIKIEALANQHFFREAIFLLVALQQADSLPALMDEKQKSWSKLAEIQVIYDKNETNKKNSVLIAFFLLQSENMWDSSKSVFDIVNLKVCGKIKNNGIENSQMISNYNILLC